MFCLHLQFRIKPDKPERKAAETACERLSDLAGKGIGTVYRSVLANAVFYLVIIDDIRDECPHDEIKEGKAEKADDIDEDIDPDRACAQKKQQKTGDRTAKAAENTDLTLAEAFGQRGGERSNRQPREHTGKTHEGSTVFAFEIVDKEILTDGLTEDLSGKNGDRGKNDADKGTTAREHGECPSEVGILLYRGLDLNSFPDEKITEEIAEDGEHRQDACCDGKSFALYDLIAVFIGGIDKERDKNTDDDIGDDGADAAEDGKRGALIGICRDGGRHGAIGDIDGGIEKTAPKKIGREHICDAKPHRGIRNGALVHQKADKRNRKGDTADPRTEFTVFFCFGAVGDPSHADIGKRIEKTRDHKKQTDKPGGNAENFGIKDHEKDTCEGEHEVVADVADEISELIGGAERGNPSIHAKISFRFFSFSFLFLTKSIFFIQIIYFPLPRGNADFFLVYTRKS